VSRLEVDSILAGATPAEVMALARLARDPSAAPPPHLCPALRAKGWVITTPTGDHLLTIAGRVLAEIGWRTELD
jgi:hypothetical protein